MSFFEALPDCKKLFLHCELCSKLRRKHACNKLVVALDGHRTTVSALARILSRHIWKAIRKLLS